MEREGEKRTARDSRRETDRQRQTMSQTDRERQRQRETETVRQRESQLVGRLLDDAALAETLDGEHTADPFFVHPSPLPNMKRRIASSC